MVMYDKPSHSETSILVLGQRLQRKLSEACSSSGAPDQIYGRAIIYEKADLMAVNDDFITLSYSQEWDTDTDMFIC